jgi:hypothetical protein
MHQATVPIYCEASFNYGGPDGLLAVTQPVLDGRAVPAEDLPFDECGFELIAAPSAVTDWSDPAQIDGVGAEEFGALAASFTGADHAVVYPAIVRDPATARRVEDYAPILFVHSDFTDDFRGMVTEEDRPYRAFLVPSLERYGLTQADVRGASRIMLLQSWRNVGPVNPDHPLAFCDARTMTDPSRRHAILVPEYGGMHLEFEAFAFTAPAAGDTDRWYTFPSLHADEAVLLRTYDSACADAGRPFWTPHSAFRDPGVPDAPENRRASVEMRALCLWQ